MPEFKLRYCTVVRVFEDGSVLIESPTFPEFSTYRVQESSAHSALETMLRKFVETLPRAELQLRQQVSTPTLRVWPQTLEPIRKKVEWRSPIELALPTIAWLHGEEAALTFAPDLGVSIVGRTAEERDEWTASELTLALKRTKISSSLRELAWLARTRELRIAEHEILIWRATPKQDELEEQKKAGQPKSVLSQVATRWERLTSPAAFEMQETVTRIAETLTSKRPRSVLLVGPPGVGKTAAVRELVRQSNAFRLGSVPFWATSGARLVAGMSGYGQWQERCQALWREAAKAGAILHLGNLVELMEVGKSVMSSLSIAGFLRPVIARGELLAIAECTPEQLVVIERADPSVLEAFYSIQVSEPSPDQGRAILRQFRESFKLPRNSAEIPPSGKDLIAPAALDTLDRLHRRYATYSAYPGRPLRFLQNLFRDFLTVDLETQELLSEIRADSESFTLQVNDLPAGSKIGTASPATLAEIGAARRASSQPALDSGWRTLQEREITAAFSRETGLPLALLDEDATLDLQAASEWFQGRVLGQSQVIELVLDLLATIKAGLARPKRPLASLLFVGPTGVGKTELAKALAEYLFGDARRLTRFDMSEYGDRLAVSRLIGGVFGAEGLLTGRIREQPFSVVLFDEFEKADPAFFDLLLQVLGEGRLTDAGGRLADFSNSVIIMTSNLGAAGFQRGSFGFNRETTAATAAIEHFTSAVQNFLRPELFNRLDRIVPFLPLDAETVLKITELQLSQLRKRDGLRLRNVLLTMAPETAEWLARRGFDPRYGARPLKRAIERDLLAPLSEGLNRYAPTLRVEAKVETRNGLLQTTVRGAPLEASQSRAASDLELAESCVELRRQTQLLLNSPAATDLQNDIYRLRQTQAAKRRAMLIVSEQDKTAKAPGDLHTHPFEGLEEEEARLLARLLKVKEALERTRRGVFALEDAALMAFHGATRFDPTTILAQRIPVQQQWDTALLALFFLQFPEADTIAFVLYGEDRATLFDLALAYWRLAELLNLRGTLCAFSTSKVNKSYEPLLRTGERTPVLWRANLQDAESFLLEPEPSVIGIGFELRGPGAAPWLSGEAGLHTFHLHELEGERQAPCAFERCSGPLAKYIPPEGVERKGYVGGQEARRTYHVQQRFAVDTLLPKQSFDWSQHGLAEALQRILRAKLRKFALEMLKRKDHE